MIKVSRLADYAIMVMGTLANTREERMTAAALSKVSSLPEPTVAKVLKLLAKKDLLISTRGVHGGYKLARAAKEITLADMVAAVDGPISLTFCVTETEKDCDYAYNCIVKEGWGKVNDAVVGALEKVSLHELLGSNVFYTEDEVA